MASAISGLKDISVLQVPHHGSATGLTEEIVSQLSPQLAVISVGKNRYGHPDPSILRILQQAKISVLRTDQSDTIALVSDGTTLTKQK
jgi:beta-lactamase superfamily II metal-dependent hydrolase